MTIIKPNFGPMKLVFATNNHNKLKEVQELIPNHIELLSLKDIGCQEDIPETHSTIAGNAIQKVEYLMAHYGYKLPDGSPLAGCFADDTGLEVKALNGEPGVYSARYAGPQRNAEDNMDKLLHNLEPHSDRSARFKTVIALILNGQLYQFTGICEGEITHSRAGDLGFGYDPIFKPMGYDQTFAQMDLTLKNQIGHRGKAVKQLIEFLNQVDS